MLNDKALGLHRHGLPGGRPDAPWHAHIYYTDRERAAAAALRDAFTARPEVVLVGAMATGPAGPHPIPQYEIHFRGSWLDLIRSMIAASGLTALVHPLTDDDLADHTNLGQWIGNPVELDMTTLDPPGANQGVARFGLSDF